MPIERTTAISTDWSRASIQARSDFTQPNFFPSAAVQERSAAPVLAAAPTGGGGRRSEIDDARTHALLAQDVYNDTARPPAGWRVADAGDLAELNLRADQLESGSFRARVYVTGSGADERYVVAFRGSQSGEDWRNNLEQGLGRNSGHYDRALRIADRIASTDAPVTFTGHSLGGGLASAAAVASGRDADTFNAAGLHQNTIDRATSLNRAAGAGGPGHVDAYFVSGEILSTVQDGGDRVLGNVFGGPLGGLLADAPSAYGQRHRLDAVTPDDKGWLDYLDPIDRHGMDWVISGLAAE